MAHVMDVRKLAAVVAQAERFGCRIAWVEDGRLSFGTTLGPADHIVDFGLETLISVTDGGAQAKAASTARIDAASLSGCSGLDIPASSHGPDDLAAHVDFGALSGRRTGAYRLILEGEIIDAKSQKELLLLGLRAIEKARPGTLALLEAERGRTKRIVSRRRESLNKNGALAMRFSQQIGGGWWVFTNNSFPETEKRLRRAAFHAGVPIEIAKLA